MTKILMIFLYIHQLVQKDVTANGKVAAILLEKHYTLLC